MTVVKAYSKTLLSGCMHFIINRYTVMVIILMFLSINLSIIGQELPEYDEIAVFLDVPGVGGGEIDALIKADEIYLPVTDLFDFLKIRNIPSPGLETITGFFVNPETKYNIDRLNNQITYQDKTFGLSPGDILRTETNLYLKSYLFGKVFGLDCKFSFRALSLTVTSKLELPIIREMKQEEMRRNIARLKGDVQADTTIGRTFPKFRFGMADWSAYTSQEINGKADVRLNLTLGGMLAGGEATASLYYNSGDPFSEKQQYYLWRYVNNDFSPLRQVLLGKIPVNSISSLFNPVVGVQLTNTPTTYRRSFGSYTLSDKTEPGWIVELYVNNVLVDYAKADASGFYTFQVPLVYGNSLVKLRFYGPWGEERIMEKNITIPYSFLPSKTLEYSLSGGFVEDTLFSRFSRGSVNYGLTNGLTVGGGVEYLSSVTSQPLMPYINASFRLTNNLIMSGDYAFGVRARGILSYRLPSNIQLDLNYTWYDRNQKAIFYNYREERKAVLSMPLKIGKVNTYQRFSVYQILLPASKYTTGEWLISGNLFGVNTNLTTYALFMAEVKPYVYSNLALSFRLPAGFILMPQVQYGYTDKELFSAKARLQKSVLKHGFIEISYEQNFANDLRLAEAGFRYDFNFAQAGASIRQYNEKTSFIQNARGSLINDRKTKYLGTDNRPNVGRAGISIVPFLDLNSNGRKDRGEPKAYGLNIHSNGGRIIRNDRDTTIRILGLEPYTDCFIELDPNSFENISWRLRKRTYKVAVDPEILKLIEIPVTIAGEATGYVFTEKDGEKKGLGRIIINIFDSNSILSGRTLTEDDGYYSYLGLSAGNFIVSVDTNQLKKLAMISDPVSIPFRIAGGTEGDIASNLNFIIKTRPQDTTGIKPQVITQETVVRKDTTYTVIHEVTERIYTITEDSWAIQIGAFKDKSLAEGFKKRLEASLGKKVEITLAGDYYRVRILDLKTRAEVDDNIVKLNKLGFRELWIIHLLAMEQQRVLITKEDSLARIRETAVIGEVPLSASEIAAIQIGNFRKLSDALDLRRSLPAAIRDKVKIEYENGLYKLVLPKQPVLDPTVLNAMKDLTPSFGRIDMNNRWKVPAGPVIPLKPVVKISVPTPEPVMIPYTQAKINYARAEKYVLAGRPELGEPTVALQVGIFFKQSDALRAQRRIMSKLGLPVEIVKQFEYYHVIVTGFYTKEETYQYYPELAGLGYPGISLLQNYTREQK